jgi:D,D-heptose 1,7-bisphosphate phosphatase
MGDLAKEIPKGLIEIGGKSILEHQVELLKKYGIVDIWMTVGHLKEPIMDYFGNGEKFGVKIQYYEEEEPLGTTGGVKKIAKELDSDFLILYGDVLVHMDLGKLIAFHKNHDADATLVVHPNDHPQDSDLVEMDFSCKITAFHSKKEIEGKFFHNMVNAGLYVLKSPVVDELPDKGDFGTDFFPAVVDKMKLFGYNTAEYLKDMGTPSRLEEVNKAFVSGKVKRCGKEHKRKAIFVDRDGTINKEVKLLHKLEDMELLPGAAEAIRKLNLTEYLVIMISNQPVVARGLVSMEGLDEIHKKMEWLLGKEGAKLDGMYFCPHHFEKGFPEENKFYKYTCLCRKPGTLMIETAVKDFNIELEGSWMIGDFAGDVLCGQNAGVKTAVIDGTRSIDTTHDGTKVKADLVVESLKVAIDTILQQCLKDDKDL